MKFEQFGLGIAKGMMVTLSNLFRQPVTTQYPEENLTVSRRIRGYELIWSEERCTGCATCAKACPQGAINIMTSTPGDNCYKVDKFELDAGYCIFCGFCVESCPYDALCFTYGYEHARYRRSEVVKSKEDLLDSKQKQASGYARPEIEAALPRQTLMLNEKHRGKNYFAQIRGGFKKVRQVREKYGT